MKTIYESILDADDVISKSSASMQLCKMLQYYFKLWAEHRRKPLIHSLNASDENGKYRRSNYLHLDKPFTSYKNEFIIAMNKVPERTTDYKFNDSYDYQRENNVARITIVDMSPRQAKDYAWMIWLEGFVESGMYTSLTFKYSEDTMNDGSWLLVSKDEHGTKPYSWSDEGIGTIFYIPQKIMNDMVKEYNKVSKVR